MSWVDEHEPGDEEMASALTGLYGEMKGVRANPTKRARRIPLDHPRKGKKGRVSPVTEYARSLGDYKTTKEVAEALGISEQWVRKAAKKRWTQAPSYVAPFGDIHIHLYTKEDIAALRHYLKERRVVTRDEFYDEET